MVRVRKMEDKKEKSVSIQPRFVHLFLIFNASVSRFVSV